MLLPDAVIHSRYRIVRLIGRGGMGAVYEAVDLRLDTTVALKQTFAGEGQLDKAFEREARLLARLRHPSLPRVTDHFVDDTGQFLAMEYIPGDDLAALLGKRGEPFSVARVLRWADQLLAVLDYLHTQPRPIIHCDIKPQNIKLNAQQEIILLDFGLARARTITASETTTGQVAGFTPQYSPPEQLQGSAVDARSDLYALAATVYRLLSGTHPEGAITRMSALLRQQPDPLTPLHLVVPHVPVALSALLTQAMAISPDDRPASAAAMREQLRAIKQIGSGAAIQPAADDDNLSLAPAGTAATAGVTVRLSTGSDEPTTEVGLPPPMFLRRGVSPGGAGVFERPAATVAPTTGPGQPDVFAAPRGAVWRHAGVFALLVVVLLGGLLLSRLASSPAGPSPSGGAAVSINAPPATTAVAGSPAPTATQPQPSPTEPVAGTTPTRPEHEWSSVVRVQQSWKEFCISGMAVLPDSLARINDMDQLSRELAVAEREGALERWPVVGWNNLRPQGHEILLFLGIANAGEDRQERLRISNTWQARLVRVGDAPERVQVVRAGMFLACGSGATYHTFPTVELNGEVDGSGKQLTTSDADFFSLARDEEEWFIASFVCRAPGVYKLSMNIPYSYQGRQDLLTAPETSEIICPASFTLLEFDTVTGSVMTRNQRWEWDGSQYVQINKGEHVQPSTP